MPCPSDRQTRHSGPCVATARRPHQEDARRVLPSVDALLQVPAVVELLNAHPRDVVVEATRDVLAIARARLNGQPAAIDVDALAVDVQARVAALFAPGPRPVVNATGVILHTNLGRAPLSDAAISAMERVARGYSALEYDLEGGKRGSRHEHASALLRRVTGAAAALVVNNNASAVLLVLAALAAGREVIISRGQLVEIGGGFRIPDVLRQSGAT